MSDGDDLDRAALRRVSQITKRTVDESMANGDDDLVSALASIVVGSVFTALFQLCGPEAAKNVIMAVYERITTHQRVHPDGCGDEPCALRHESVAALVPFFGDEDSVYVDALLRPAMSLCELAANPEELAQLLAQMATMLAGKPS